jgi:hypothetical protein
MGSVRFARADQLAGRDPAPGVRMCRSFKRASYHRLLSQFSHAAKRPRMFVLADQVALNGGLEADMDGLLSSAVTCRDFVDARPDNLRQ